MAVPVRAADSPFSEIKREISFGICVCRSDYPGKIRVYTFFGAKDSLLGLGHSSSSDLKSDQAIFLSGQAIFRCYYYCYYFFLRILLLLLLFWR